MDKYDMKSLVKESVLASFVTVLGFFCVFFTHQDGLSVHCDCVSGGASLLVCMETRMK